MGFLVNTLQLMSAIPHPSLQVYVPLFDDRWKCFPGYIRHIIWPTNSASHSAIRFTAPKRHFALRFGDSGAVCLYF